MAQRETVNQTMVTGFILLGFRTVPELQSLLFVVFLVIYVVTMAGNILIAMVLFTNHHLHKPMYFFLGCLSVLETCYSSTILPRALIGFITEYNWISFTGCFLQFYFIGTFACTECFLLSAMSYDRYLAICKPLHYAALINSRLCIQLSLTSWIISMVATTFTTFFASQLTFCGPNEIDHFFCDYTPLLMLSCSDTHQTETLISVLGSTCTVPPMLLTLISYVCIICTILKIPSTTGRSKAFSTCSSHLIVVTIYYGTLIVVYILPKSSSMKDLNKIFSVFYAILTPMINPFIYTLRNREFKAALRKAFRDYQSMFLQSEKKRLHYYNLQVSVDKLKLEALWAIIMINSDYSNRTAAYNRKDSYQWSI
ncbi:olfactory receptor 6B1-like [Sceloporus undulatus]|uniref:olfactory receptor 6B1-like n=1 Tax=Sceloporus undulatus TaxID=8520 RepID=UPI001C4D6E86|nr:olfactory receptor 6B1-like [Sceloporus undulatus]